ncbi:MAG: alpha/beta fold hydrolase [Zetaproteobacteria bacterium]|nr:MAG: alpha/beta fold hydrolase [Zetaproteobacteria bacterium]
MPTIWGLQAQLCAAQRPKRGALLRAFFACPHAPRVGGMPSAFASPRRDRHPFGAVVWALVLALQGGCASLGAPSSQQAIAELWKGWAEIDALMQPNYPEAVPIVLVHGWNGSEFSWPPPERLAALEARLKRDIYYFTYRTGPLPARYPPLEALEEQLERFIAAFKQVDIVAHSMGGLLVRQYLAHHPKGRVRRVVMLSSPHFGANAAALLAEVASSITAEGHAQAQEIMPGSAFLWALNEAEGAELAGVEALNAYAEDHDLVVDPSAAWLPWAPNVAVSGDHHTLAHNFDRFPFILRFLETGEPPARLAPMPKKKTVWLRMQRADGTFARFSEASVKRFNAQGLPTKQGITLCCINRTALFDPGGTTIVIENAAPGERLLLIDRAKSPPRKVFVTLPSELPYPVVMLVANEQGRIVFRPRGRFWRPAERPLAAQQPEKQREQNADED